jgi:hypothetical protein
MGNSKAVAWAAVGGALAVWLGTKPPSGAAGEVLSEVVDQR